MVQPHTQSTVLHRPLIHDAHLKSSFPVRFRSSLHPSYLHLYLSLLNPRMSFNESLKALAGTTSADDLSALEEDYSTMYAISRSWSNQPDR